jgi:hypothetical protein
MRKDLNAKGFVMAGPKEGTKVILSLMIKSLRSLISTLHLQDVRVVWPNYFEEECQLMREDV